MTQKCVVGIGSSTNTRETFDKSLSVQYSKLISNYS